MLIPAEHFRNRVDLCSPRKQFQNLEKLLPIIIVDPKETMLQASAVFLLLATSAFAARVNTIIRQNDNPNEIVMIGSCSKGSGGNIKTND